MDEVIEALSNLNDISFKGLSLISVLSAFVFPFMINWLFTIILNMAANVVYCYLHDKIFILVLGKIVCKLKV